MMQEKRPFAVGKFFLSAGLIAVSIAYTLWQQMTKVSPITIQNSETQNPSVPAATPVQSPAHGPMMGSMMPGTRMMRALFTDGSYVGDAVDAFYGMVQVKAVVMNGKLADVQILKFPNDRETSIGISNRSLPILTQEAIRAQSATVDTVSGATETSEGFRTSLASALVKAEN